MIVKDNYTFKLLRPNDKITEEQKSQLENIIKDGFEEKFFKTFHDDRSIILSIIRLVVKYKLIPLDEVFCAIDKITGEIVSVCCLNNFKEPDKATLARFALDLIKLVGIRRSIEVMKGFLILDGENKKLESRNYISEIYLISTRKGLRGLGIGTGLLNRVLNYIDFKCGCENNRECRCRVKMLVFANNPALRLYERLGFKQVKTVATPGLVKPMGENYSKLIQLEKNLCHCNL